MLPRDTGYSQSSFPKDAKKGYDAALTPYLNNSSSGHLFFPECLIIGVLVHFVVFFHLLSFLFFFAKIKNTIAFQIKDTIIE